MQLVNNNSDKPIFLQISSGIEDAILSNIFPEDTQIPSITEFSVSYKINPATALKGINLLVDSGILYKKRGIGMFVSKGAAGTLRQSRKEEFAESYISGLVAEAKRLGITFEDICSMLKQQFDDEQ